jgi:asparagine synthase (glutamine-hydrolysing)
VCGIAGAVEAAAPVDVADLRLMAAALRHRGPDDDGFYVSAADRGAAGGLAFRRLAIIDVEGGHQPIPNEDGSVWVICNGEIYNFRELRAELERKGHVFRTRSDTEVLVHLWEDEGPRLVQRLNGMFGLAIWDERQRSLFLARDRLGKKPLYYMHSGKRLLFASEVKGILAHPGCVPELDEQALAEYLAFEYVPAPRSIFRGISKLERGHTLLWNGGRVAVEPYWEPSFDTVAGRAEAEWADELIWRLREAVRLRLVSDVPLGVFLSGGIDSSAVVALMADIAPAGGIKTFSIGFREESFDESRYARLLAQRLGTEHHEQIVSANDMADVLPEIAAVMDEPLGDASIVPTYLLSRFTRQQVTVALGGDGGDELFAGYPTFAAHRAANLYRVPGAIHHALLRGTERLPVSTANFSLDFKIKRFLSGAREPLALRDQVWLGSLSPEQQQDVLTRPSSDPYAPLRSFTASLPLSDPVQRLVAQYLRFYLEGDILVKVDRASMANSLEVRAPMLDHTFVSFVNSMPSSLKLHGLRSKHILKRALRPWLPAEIVNRKKKGFGVPVAQWLNDELRGLADELLSESALEADGLFHAAGIRELLHQHRTGRRDNRKPLWTLIVFQLWYRQWLSPAARRPPAPQPGTWDPRIHWPHLALNSSAQSRAPERE